MYGSARFATPVRRLNEYPSSGWGIISISDGGVVRLAATSRRIRCVYIEVEAVSTKSTAVRRYALRHCVIRVNSRSACDSTINIAVDIIVTRTPVSVSLSWIKVDCA